MVTKKTEEKCLIKKCTGKAKWKGLCGKCHHEGTILIETKQVANWEELEAMGLCAIERPFLEAFNKIKKATPEKSSDQNQFSEEFKSAQRDTAG